MRTSLLRPLLDPEELSARITSWASGNAPQAPPQHPPTLLNSTPVSLLPPELLSEIFLFCLPTERFPTPSSTGAPVLTHVCSQWRQLALATPDLWTGIHLHYRSRVEDVPAMEAWLSRSGDKPLSLSLSIDFDERSHQAILNLLCRHARRWKHVQFNFRNLSCPQVYHLDLALDNVPMLSSFEFHVRDISTSNVVPITRLLTNAPNLKELTWVDDLADTETLLTLPLSRLSRLSLSMSFGSLDYLQLLGQCLNLEHVRITRPGPEIRLPRTPLLLPKLTSLNIAHDLTGILDHLILPSLKHVRVHLDADSADDGNGRASRSGASALSLASWAVSSFNESDDSRRIWDPEHLVQLIERSSCHIESLCFNAPMKDDHLSMCLKACHESLKSITISGAMPSTSLSALVRTLTPTTTPLLPSRNDDNPLQDYLFPQLVELNIDTRISSACSLVEMVQRRMEIPLTNMASTSPTYRDAPCIQILPLSRLRLQYPAGHKDISVLRDIAAAANQQRRNTLDLKIIESRVGNLRGSSAGRIRPYMFRRNVAASR